MGRHLWLLLPLILVGSCVQAQNSASRRPSNLTWYSPNFTDSQFAKDKYQCMKETGSDGKIIDLDAVGPFRKAMLETSLRLQQTEGDYRMTDRIKKTLHTQRLFIACMESKGYNLQRR